MSEFNIVQNGLQDPQKVRKIFRRAVLRAMDWALYKAPLGLFISPNVCARLAIAVGRKEIDPPEKLNRFWQQEKPHGNYFAAPQSSPRGETVIAMLRSRINPDYSIPEVGCNVGRNLNHLYRAGYKRVAGIEINEKAVKRLRSVYPDLDSVNVNVGSAEEVLARYPSRSVDVVFTMAVLEHIHPSKKAVFSEIARVAGRYVLAIEPREGHATHRQYPWNIQEQFESLGLKLIDRKTWTSLWITNRSEQNEWKESINDYDAMLFQVEEK